MDIIDEVYADKDLSLLKKLTLVIPTYNRTYYLSRCLWYHSHFPFGEIIVADSSVEDMKVINRETVAKIRDTFVVNVRYLEYEPETEMYGGDIFRKWGDAVQHVETEYSQICTDREFQIPTTETWCIQFLADHEEYAIAKGMTHYLSQHKKQITYIPCQSNSSNQAPDLYARMLFTLIKGFDILGVYRSDLHKSIYNDYNDYDINDLRFGEAMLMFATILSGKYMQNDTLSLTLRDSSNMGKSNSTDKQESSTNRYPPLSLYPKNYFNKRYYQLKQYILDTFNNDSRDVTNNIDEMVEAFLPNYLERAFGYQNSMLNKSPILTKIWKNIPLSLKNIIRIITVGDDKRFYNEINCSDDMKIIGNIILKSKYTEREYTQEK